MPFMPHFSLRTSLLALFVAAGITPVVAGEGDISYRRAAAIAKQYVRLSATAQRTLKSRTLSNQTGAPYYLFNDATNNGFVLVAGNDAMGTVLAHGIEAPLDTLHAPEGLQFLLEAYRERFQTVQKLSTADRKRYFTAYSTNGTYTPVTPLLKSKWNQHYPYNNKRRWVPHRLCSHGCSPDYVLPPLAGTRHGHEELSNLRGKYRPDRFFPVTLRMESHA